MNVNSKGLRLDDIYSFYSRQCSLYNRNPMSKLLYARLLHDIFPSLISKRVKTENGTKASKNDFYFKPTPFNATYIL